MKYLIGQDKNPYDSKINSSSDRLELDYTSEISWIFHMLLERGSEIEIGDFVPVGISDEVARDDSGTLKEYFERIPLIPGSLEVWWYRQ